MRNNLRDNVYRERIENMVSDGIPDVLLMARGVTIPCELKSVHALPVRATTRVFGADGLDADQRNWHLRWKMHGGTSLIVCSAGKGSQLRHWAIRGEHADAFNNMTRADLDANCVVRAALNGAWLGFWVELSVWMEGRRDLM